MAPRFPVSTSRARYLESFQFLNGSYLMPLDGSEYFSSKNISCPGCLKKEKPAGDIHYHHQILQAVIVHPDIKQVLPPPLKFPSPRIAVLKFACWYC